MSCILGCNSTYFESGEDEKQVDVGIQSVPESIVVFGQITDCAKNNQPVEGALVKAFKSVDNKLTGICHTFSGCNGFYMLNLPHVSDQDKILIMASCGCVKPPFCASCHPDCKCPTSC